MTDPRFPNDVSVYGVEIKTDIVIKQTVPKTSKTNKGNVGRVQEYKTFYKDGKTSIYPVDSSGKILQGAKLSMSNYHFIGDLICKVNLIIKRFHSYGLYHFY